MIAEELFENEKIEGDRFKELMQGISEPALADGGSFTADSDMFGRDE